MYNQKMCKAGSLEMTLLELSRVKLQKKLMVAISCAGLSLTSYIVQYFLALKNDDLVVLMLTYSKNLLQNTHTQVK